MVKMFSASLFCFYFGLFAGSASAQSTESESLGERDKNQADSASEKSSDWLQGRRRPGAFFGFGVAKPESIGEYNHFSKLYGKGQNELSLMSGYYLYSKFIDVGLGLKFGYFHASGHPVKAETGLEFPADGDYSDAATVDPNQTIEMTLLPMQVLGHLAISPWASRRLVFRGWLGKEWLYVQESIKPNLPPSVSVKDSSTLVNKGWNKGTVLGAMISISLSGLEARSDYALASLGIDRVYVSPFLEIVKTDDAKMGNFDRRSYGIAFSFESLR